MYEKIDDFFFRVYRITGRLLIKYSGNPRPPSPPYITGDGFRSMASHIYDAMSQSIDPEAVKEREIVFVGDSNIKKFLVDIHPKIKVRYILVTHNGDEAVDDEAASYIDDKIIKWYGINVTASHPKVVPLPLGIANKHFYVTGIPRLFRDVKDKNYPKMNKIFYGFTVSTNPKERGEALALLQKHPLAETLVTWKNFKSYLHLLGTYKAVVSPPGSSVEGHRTWDALYIGMIPIVKSSITMDYFESLKMPIWVMHDWKELESVDEKAIADKFDSILKNCDEKVLYLEYWIDKIKNAKS